MSKKKRVLLVEDSAMSRQLIEGVLRSDGFHVSSVDNGAQGLKLAKKRSPDVILLDIEMPGMDGFEVCRRLKQDPHLKLIPVVFVTAHDSTVNKVKGLDLGAMDYVTKPFDHAELKARVRSAYRTKFLLDLLEHNAQIDGLTGLANRASFDRRIVEEYERTNRYGGRFSLVMLDIDDFKQINDSHGHLFGDSVLSEVSELLRSTLRGSDFVARYGGEEFVALLPEQDLERARQLAERVRELIEAARPGRGGQAIPVTASFGVASSDQATFNMADKILEAADDALYHAKRNGKNRVCCWDDGLATGSNPSLGESGSESQ